MKEPTKRGDPFEGLPPRFREARVEHVDPLVFPCVTEYVGDFEARVRAHRGLLLSGPPGIGKTYAVAALTRLYQESVRIPRWHFETEYKFVERYAPVVRGPDSIDARRGQPWTRTFDEVFWLVLNDVGKAYRAGKLELQVIHKLGRCVRERNERELPIFITTNLPLSPRAGVKTFTEVFGESVTSLLREMVDAYEITGAPDRRGMETETESGQ